MLRPSSVTLSVPKDNRPPTCRTNHRQLVLRCEDVEAIFLCVKPMSRVIWQLVMERNKYTTVSSISSVLQQIATEREIVTLQIRQQLDQYEST